MAIPDVEIWAVLSLLDGFIYSPDGTNVYGSRGREFEGIESVYRVN